MRPFSSELRWLHGLPACLPGIVPSSPSLIAVASGHTFIMHHARCLPAWLTGIIKALDAAELAVWAEVRKGCNSRRGNI
jgi:hypothetical protein